MKTLKTYFFIPLFIVTTALIFLLLYKYGHGFPGINPTPRQLTVSDRTTESELTPNMVYVKGGTFRMGGLTGKSRSALPVREININNFIISRYEITFVQFDRFCEALNILLPPDGGYGRGSRPVGNVNWYDAVRYCNWLSQYESLDPCYQFFPDQRDKGNMSIFDTEKLLVIYDPSKNGYRLPSEAEWEFAAAGGVYSRSYIYSGSNKVDEVAWYFDNGGKYPNRVGEKLPNELGLYDMSGNVFEWTSGRYMKNYKDIQDGDTNPVGPDTGSSKVVRGGSCFFDRWGCKICYRKALQPASRVPYVGFRVVRSVL